MIVAVVAMRMVQVAVDQVIDVVAMRDGLVSAARAMNVLGIMAAAIVVRRTSVRIRRGNRDHVFFDAAAIRMVEMPVVQVVDVPFVFDCRVPTTRSMLVGVAFVNVASRHVGSPTSSEGIVGTNRRIG